MKLNIQFTVFIGIKLNDFRGVAIVITVAYFGMFGVVGRNLVGSPKFKGESSRIVICRKRAEWKTYQQKNRGLATIFIVNILHPY